MHLIKTAEEKKKLQKAETNRKRVKAQYEKEKNEPHICNENAFVCFKNIQKVYPNGVHSVIDFNLDIQKGEFIVFVGPSGCGKTTTLRMVCGLEEISAGQLFIDGVYSNELPPNDRGVSIVFQNYALFPHLTVYENIAYGLKIKRVLAPKLDQNGKQAVGIDEAAIKRLEKEKKWILQNQPGNVEDLQKIDHDIREYKNNKIPLYVRRKLTKAEIDEKVNHAAEILNLKELLGRKPGQLSGGQCQRVALGRVIVSNAKLLLMDEPLSNLDAKLRVSMRREIIALHQTLNATTIYVTHDQVEAMTMSSRLVVMNKGYIQQIGTPEEVYQKPNCLFVATFIGSPSMNIFSAEVEKSQLLFLGKYYPISEAFLNKISLFYQQKIKMEEEKIKNFESMEIDEDERENIQNRLKLYQEAEAQKKYTLKIGIRPEDFELCNHEESLEGKIVSIEKFGDENEIQVQIGSSSFLVKCSSENRFHIADTIHCLPRKNKIHIFDMISEERFDF